MAKTRKLIVDVIADASKFTRELNKADGYSKRLKGSMQQLGKSMGVGIAAAGAAATAFGISALKSAEEAEQVQKRVAAIIKATGGAANVTSKEIEKFASTQQMLVGVDDEVLKKSYGILLTFKNVRNEAGKGNDIFNRTAKSLADLAAAGFGNTDSAAKAMGKALQDPIKGVTALSRAGVTFSQAQKDQIKGFVESNDLLSAQKLILAEVEGQVGGTAAAGVTASEKLKIAYGELQERVGQKLLPVFQRLSDWFLKEGIPAGEKFFAFVKENGPVVKALTIVLGGLAAMLVVVNIAMWAMAANPIVLIAAAISAVILILIAVLAVLYVKFEGVRQVVDVVAQAMVNAWAFIATAIRTGVTTAVSLFSVLGEKIAALWERVRPIGEAIGNLFGNVFSGIRDSLRNGWNLLVQAVNPILRKLSSVPLLGWLPDELPTWPAEQQARRRVPFMGDGGVVTRATEAIVGERGPEAIIPLDRFNFAAGSSTTNVTINVTASPLSNPAEVGAAVVDALKAYERRNGVLPLRVA